MINQNKKHPSHGDHSMRLADSWSDALKSTTRFYWNSGKKLKNQIN